MLSEPSELFCDVAIIGAGFSGTMTAIHLLTKNQPGISVALIERKDRFRQGVAYSTKETSHMLNVPAGKMSAFPDRPSHFFDWHSICAASGFGSTGAQNASSESAAQIKGTRV